MRFLHFLRHLDENKSARAEFIGHYLFKLFAGIIYQQINKLNRSHCTVIPVLTRAISPVILHVI